MANAKTPPRLGRSAMIAQGLGLLAAGIGSAAYFIPAVRDGKDAIAGMSLSAALAFFPWSLVLAFRAMLRREDSRWAWVIFYVSLVEYALPALALWTQTFKNTHWPAVYWLMWLGVPVFVPFLTIGSMIATPIAFWRSRKDGRQPQRTLALWYAGIMLALAMVFIPPSLFLFGATTISFYSQDEIPMSSLAVVPAVAWPARLASSMPNFIRDNVESMVRLCCTDHKQYEFLVPIYVTGNVSADRMESRFREGNNGFQKEIWYGLKGEYPDRALAVAMEILARRIKGVHAQVWRYYADYIAENGKTEHLCKLLDEDLAYSRWSNAQERVIDRFLSELAVSADLLPHLQKYLLRSENSRVRLKTMRLMDKIMTPRLALKNLTSNDIDAHRATMLGLLAHNFKNESSAPPGADRVSLIRCFHGFLISSDNFMRLTAMCALVKILHYEPLHRDVCSNALNRILNSTSLTWSAVVESDEIEEITRLNSFVLDWFENNKLSIAEPK